MRRPGPYPEMLVLLALLAPAAAQPAAAEQAAPTRAQTQQVLTAMDKAFNAGDLDAFLSHFNPSHHTLGEQLRARMKAVLSFGAKLKRSSEILGELDVRHRRAIALVRSRTGCCVREELEYVEHSYLVVRLTAKGPKAQFMVPVNKHVLPFVKRGRFSCPACNYSFGGNTRWLTVPARPDQTGCMESLTFIALEHDLVAEASVHVLDKTLPATEAITEFLESMGQLPWVKVGERTKVSSWTPPAYAQGEPPKHLDGARCTVPLKGGDTAWVHLATFGPIRYLIVVHGKPAVLESQKTSIQDLLKGFELLRKDKAPHEICRAALGAHTGGGAISGNTYANRKHNLKVKAPQGWKGDAFASRHLFRVRFTSQLGASNLLLQAMAPPVGFANWPKDKAEQLFMRSCANQQLDPGTDTGWKRATQGFQWREVRDQEKQAHRVLRLAIRGSILILMAGEASDEPSLAAIQKAMDSLAPLR
ncbi:MAG: hypothetical protein V3U11_02065 [Planctomycetota bacterium]